MKTKEITCRERLKIEVYYKSKKSTKDIAILINRSVRTIQRELKRGYCRLISSDYIYYDSYSADIAQSKADERKKCRGRELKIGKDISYSNFIEDMILNYKYSPYAVLQYIENYELQFETKISKTTFYRYIDSGLFLHLTNKNLPQGKRKTYNKVKRTRLRNVLAKSIEDRDKNILSRQDFGHWELDTVIGQKKKNNCLLVLTERKTRYEHIIKIKDKSSASVIKGLKHLRKQYSDNVFKTVTCDNGGEFFGSSDIEKLLKTQLYYCHPFCSSERGSNENCNKLIRRHIPKGVSINKYKHSDIEKIEKWINNYPRYLHNGQTSAYLFQQELQKLQILPFSD